MKNIRLYICSSLALMALPHVGLGQTQAAGAKATPLSKVERKNKAPVSKDILRVQLPKPVELKLDNGLTVLVLEDHRLPTVTVQLIVQGAGALNDPSDLPGLAYFTAAMLREGTSTRSSKQIAEQTEQLGATIGTSAPYGSNVANLNASGLSDNVGQWLGLAADVLLNPSFPQDELNKLKQRTRVQLQQQRSSPYFLMTERFNRAVYGDHPAAVTSTTPAAIDKITPELLAKWHKERYVPQNSILAIAGDVRPADLMQMFNGLPSWKATDMKAAVPAATKPVSGRRVYLVDRPGAVQTNVFIGNIAISRTDPDYFPLVVMDNIVGGGAAARLFLNLREEHGYTYGAYSSLITRQYAGPWIAQANMRNDATSGAMTEFMKEINRIRDEKVPESELEERKRCIVASFALSLEEPSELLAYATTVKIYGLPADYWDTYPTKIMNVTAEQVQRVARKYVVPDDLQIVAVGDAAKIKPVLEKYGKVEVFDMQGKKRAE